MSLLSQVPPTSLRGRTWALCHAQSSPRAVRVPMCTHTQVPAGTTHPAGTAVPCTHTDASYTTDAHTQTHTDRHARRRSQSLGLARLSAISGPLHWLFALPRRHSRDTCLAHSLNSCLRCCLLEALLGHIAVGACVPQPGPTHYPLTQLPPPADMARAGELPGLEHSSASPFPLLGPPAARLPLLTRWSRLPSVCQALC